MYRNIAVFLQIFPHTRSFFFDSQNLSKKSACVSFSIHSTTLFRYISECLRFFCDFSHSYRIASNRDSTFGLILVVSTWEIPAGGHIVPYATAPAATSSFAYSTILLESQRRFCMFPAQRGAPFGSDTTHAQPFTIISRTTAVTPSRTPICGLRVQTFRPPTCCDMCDRRS